MTRLILSEGFISLFQGCTQENIYEQILISLSSVDIV